MADETTTTGAPVVAGVSDLVVIGQGGYGVVYRGRQADFGRDVAVKVLVAPGVDPMAVERWRREITAMGRLSNHPNIVPVYSAGVTDEGHPYLLMPYVAGGSLHDRIRGEGPVAPAELVTLGTKLAGGLAAAHAAGVLHRDLKPANVLLSEYGEPQLSDFGIARLVDAGTTTTGSIQATIGYAAPEVLSGEGATEASDVYGLGATLHAAARAAAPFAGLDGEPMIARVGRVLTQPPPDLAAAGVPPALAAVLDRCLAKDPALRPGSAEALRDELAALDLEGAPAALPPERTEVLPVAPVPTPSLTPGVRVPAPAPAAAVAAPPPLAPPSTAADDDGSRRRALLAVAVLVLLAGLGAVAVWALLGDDDEGVTADATTTTVAPSTTATPSTTAPPPSSTETTVPETTTTSPTTTSTTTTTTTPPTTTAPEAPTAEALEDAASTYYATVAAGDVETGWTLLSPRFQQQSNGGFEGYRRWWTEDVAGVSVQGPPRGNPEDGTVALTLRYDLASGRSSTEAVVLTFVAGDEGQLLIDQYATSGSGGPGPDPEAADGQGAFWDRGPDEGAGPGGDED